MKSMKLLLVAILTVALGMSVTSCLKNDENNIDTLATFVKVDAYSYPVTFQEASGITLIPTQTITTADKRWAFIYCQYDRSTLDESAKTLSVTLSGNPSYFNDEAVTMGTVTGNAPIATLTPTDGYRYYPAFFFDKNNLLLSIGYKSFKKDTDAEQNTEDALHTFTMTYDAATGYADGKLTLKLVHNISGLTDTDSRTNNALVFKGYNISNVLSTLSSTPTQVEVVIMENMYNDKLASASEKKYTFTYDFKD